MIFMGFLSPFTQVFRDEDETSENEKYQGPNFFLPREPQEDVEITFRWISE